MAMIKSFFSFEFSASKASSTLQKQLWFPEQILKCDMKALSQHLKEETRLKKKKGLHKYLDELVEMMTHHLGGRHSREHLHVLSNKSVLRPRQGDPASSQMIGDQDSTFSFYLSPVRYLLLWGLTSSTEVSGEAVLIASVPRSGWSRCSDRAALLHHPHILGPKIRQRLILPGPHLLWLNLVVIPARGKCLLKK